MIKNWDRIKNFVSDGMALINAQGQIQDVNCVLEILLGYDLHELKDQPINKFLPIVLEEELHLTDIKCKAKDGETLTVEVHVMSYSSEPENTYLVIVKDFSTRKNLVQAIVAKESQLNSLIEAMPCLVYQLTVSTNQQFAITFMSFSIQELFGINVDFLTERPTIALDLVHPDDQKSLVNSLKTSLLRPSSYRWQGRVKLPSGKLRWIENHWRAQRVNESVLMSGVIIDVHEKKEVEERLEQEKALAAHASKLSMLGELAGGIAHEINTPLGTIQLTMESLRNNLEQASPDLGYCQKMVDTSIKVAQKLATIIKAFKGFVRDGSQDQAVAVCLKEIVDECLLLTQQRIKYQGVKLEINYHLNSDDKINCRPTEFIQVLVNLINNAVDAISAQESPWITVEISRRPDRCLVIEIIDCGKGIPEPAASNIFQSYFTTKPKGVGTGLGLYISRRIVESHGGKLYYDRERCNTTFIIEMPENVHSPKVHYG